MDQIQLAGPKEEVGYLALWASAEIVQRTMHTKRFLQLSPGR